jgi:hypothetical protein
LETLQQLLEAANITKRAQDRGRTIHNSREGSRDLHPVLTQLATGHKTLQIEMDTLEFPMIELQEQVKVIRHMNIVVS